MAETTTWWQRLACWFGWHPGERETASVVQGVRLYHCTSCRALLYLRDNNLGGARYPTITAWVMERYGL